MKTGHNNVETASPDRYGILKDFARSNRSLPTDAEHVLWQYLKRSQLGVRFRRQHAIYDYIVDFISLSANLIIEVDGDYHNDGEQQKQDKQRQQKLESLGYQVMRFTNDEILNDIDNVIDKISSNI